MKLWAKIVIGTQTFLIVFFILFAKIKASEAERLSDEALRNYELAQAAQADAEEVQGLAQEQAAAAARAQQEAWMQMQLAVEAHKKAQEALEACQSKKQ